MREHPLALLPPETKSALLDCPTCAGTTSHRYVETRPIWSSSRKGTKPTDQDVLLASEHIFACDPCGHLRRWGFDAPAGQAAA